jgi:hypothetical protein
MWQCNLFWSVIDLNTPKLGWISSAKD